MVLVAHWERDIHRVLMVLEILVDRLGQGIRQVLIILVAPELNQCCFNKKIPSIIALTKYSCS